jgi:transcriptional regulator with XRE-family HTH domain
MQGSGISIRLRQVRQQKSLSQSEISNALGIPQSAYSRYERGTLDLPNKHIVALQLLYNVNPEWLKEGEGQMFLDNNQPEKRMEKPNTMTLPQRIKAFREHLGITELGLADILMLDDDEPDRHSEESVKALERGDKVPSQMDYLKLLGYYERLNENWLRYGEGEMLLPEKETPPAEG